MRALRTIRRSLGVVAILILLLIVIALVVSIQPLTVVNISSKPIESLSIQVGTKEIFAGSLAPDETETARFVVRDDSTYRVTARFQDGTTISEEIGYLTPLDTGRQTLEIGTSKIIWDHLWVVERGGLERRTTTEEAPGAWESLEQRTRPRL
jgi:hypothetical protein